MEIKRSIGITGASGFVGKNIIKYFKSKYLIYSYPKGGIPLVKQNIVLHFAGKAHDTKNISNPEEYYVVNTEYTKVVFNSFLKSESDVFVFLSSVKAVSDNSDFDLSEDHVPNPISHYGKSKLLAEQYILSKNVPENKRVFILRACMIHGPQNKGNLNLLFKMVNKGFPWPLGAFSNKRSFCSIDNLCFVIQELIENENIPSGIYNVADDDPISTNELIELISFCHGKSTIIWNIHPVVIKIISLAGDIFKLPLNSKSLNKLIENYVVSNKKILDSINKPLPTKVKEGLIKTLNSFKK